MAWHEVTVKAVKTVAVEIDETNDSHGNDFEQLARDYAIDGSGFSDCLDEAVITDEPETEKEIEAVKRHADVISEAI